MTFQGILLVVSTVAALGFAIYQYYQSQNTPESYSNGNQNRSIRTAHVRRGMINGLIEDCAICMSPMVTGIKVLNCQHYFHERCIAKWLQQQKTCPICRKNCFVPWEHCCDPLCLWNTVVIL